MNPGVWIFGYGSLVWRPAFPHAERHAAVVSGWARRFWQGSTDHRGVPGAPGRVVTLAQEPEERCWGVAYRLPESERDGILDRLDHRERGGYERQELDLELACGDRVTGLTYVATPSNPNYLGPAPLAEIALQVRRSRGPSGANLEYVLRLAEALRGIEAEDAHVFELEALLRASGQKSHG